MKDTTMMDLVVSDICANILNQYNINERIELVEFFPEDEGHKLYFKYALMVASWKNEKVYINLPFKIYIKLIFKNWKSRKTIKRSKVLKGKDSIDQILGHICKVHGINYTFYKKIYNEYIELKGDNNKNV